MALFLQLCSLHTFLSLATFPICSSPWQILHSFGISNILVYPMQPRPYLHSFMQCQTLPGLIGGTIPSTLAFSKTLKPLPCGPHCPPASLGKLLPTPPHPTPTPKRKKTWAGSFGPTWWKEGTNFHKLSSDSHIYILVYMPCPKWTYK